MPSDTYTLTISDLGVAAVADNAVTTAKIANYDIAVAGTGVTTAKIVDLNVTTAKIADSAITTAKLVDSSSTTTGVTTAKIAAGAITDVKLATNAVTTIKITDLNVTTDKLAVAAVTNDKLAVITGTGKIANSATTATDANTASTIVARDGGGNFSAGTITAALAGNATTATTATNLAVGTAGALPYQTAAGATGFISAAATGNVLLSGGAATVPQYGPVPLATHVAGTLPVGNGGTGVTAASTGSGGVVLSSGPTLVAPVLGTPAVGSILTNCTGLPLTSGAGVTGILPVAYGGTGAASLTGYVKASGTAVMTASASVPVGEISGTLPIDKGGTNQSSTVRGQISKMTTFTAITVASTGAYYPATNDGTLDTTTSSNMTLGATSTFSIRNTSGVTRIFRVYASADATASANDTLGIKLYSGTAGSLTQIDATECRAFTNSATEAAKLVTSWMISLSNNQEVALYVANHTDVANITIQRARLIAEAII